MIAQYHGLRAIMFVEGEVFRVGHKLLDSHVRRNAKRCGNFGTIKIRNGVVPYQQESIDVNMNICMEHRPYGC